MEGKINLPAQSLPRHQGRKFPKVAGVRESVRRRTRRRITSTRSISRRCGPTRAIRCMKSANSSSTAIQRIISRKSKGTPPGQPPYQGHPQYQQTPYEQPYQQAQSYGQQPGPPSGHRGRPARKSWPRRHKVLTVLGSLALILVIVGIASGKTKQAGNASAVATTMPIRTTIPTPTHHATTPRVVPGKAPVATQAATPPPAPTTRAPVSTTPKPTATAHAAAPPPPPATTPAGCRPRTNGGNCYEPGEYCRDADHGASGIAGDGEAITCEDNDGWRWEPS